MTSIAVAYVISDIFYLYQESLFLKVAYYGVSRRISVHAGILSAVFVDGSVVVHNVDNRQIVSLSHFEVVGIVSRRDLYCAGTEIFFYVSIRYNGDKSAYERQNKVFAYQFLYLGSEGCTATAVSPKRVSGLVVAITISPLPSSRG